jgi:hypothetical protein
MPLKHAAPLRPGLQMPHEWQFSPLMPHAVWAVPARQATPFQQPVQHAPL